MKGVSLVQGQCVVLAIDGSLVYVETVTNAWCEVVALPDQPKEREEGPVFTPGRVGAKKISPFSAADKVVEIADLSERNKKFIGEFEALRKQHGPNYVDRTPEEQAAFDAANAPKVPKAKQTPEQKAAAKEARKAERKAAKQSGPKFLQRCTQCGEQSGHPNHPDDHAFVAPAAPPPAVVLCAACDEPESDDVHTKAKADGGHKFIAGKKAKAERAPREPKVRAERPAKASKTLPAGKHRWVGDDDKLKVLRAVNPKYNEGNSGMMIVDAIKGAGPEGLTPVEVMTMPKAPSTVERVQLAFQQLLNAGMIEAVA